MPAERLLNERGVRVLSAEFAGVQWPTAPAIPPQRTPRCVGSQAGTSLSTTSAFWSWATSRERLRFEVAARRQRSSPNVIRPCALLRLRPACSVRSGQGLPCVCRQLFRQLKFQRTLKRTLTRCLILKFELRRPQVVKELGVSRSGSGALLQ
jgi:hypothetical protein